MHTKQQYKYSKIPQEEPDYKNKQSNSITKKTISEHADNILGVIIANGAKIFAPSEYSKILRERVAEIIVEEMQNVLKTKDVACVIDAKHICINSRGVCDPNSSTITSEFGGVVKNEARKNEFLDYIKIETEF